MRDIVIAGNWKMNTIPSEGKSLVLDVLDQIQNVDLTGKKVVFGCPMVSITTIAKTVDDADRIYVSAQNVSEHESGAYTGETSAAMIVGAGGKMVIVGHSERREYHNESNALLAKKVDQCFAHGLTPIYCCGEVLEERKSGDYKAVIQSQIEEGIFHLSADQIKNVIIAYEPVWAIGTGETATPDQAQEVHAFIRQILTDKYGADIAQGISILYGGSMKPANAADLISMEDIDGGLIGGASLKAADFVEIIKSV